MEKTRGVENSNGFKKRAWSVVIRMRLALNYNRSGTISQGGEIEADFVFTLQVDPVLFKNFVKKLSFLYP